MTSWARAGRWAVPVVVTVALAPACKSNEPKSGCEPPECHMNPPGVEPTVEPSSTPPPEPAVSATSVASTTSPEPAVDELPEAPLGGAITRDGDKCYYRPQFRCPEGRPGEARPTCNPPGARLVKCPPE